MRTAVSFSCGEAGFNLHVFREPSFFQFGENRFPVHSEFKSSPSRGNQGETRDIRLVFFQQMARQTDGLIFIPSHRAVDEFDIHCRSPYGFCHCLRIVDA